MLRPIYGRNNRPSRSTIERLVENFESTGTVQNVIVPVLERCDFKMIRIFIEKSSSAMRLISSWMASSTKKICIIGQTAIHTYSMSHHCIPEKLRVAVVYGPAASLGRTSSVIIRTGTLLLPFNDNRMFLAPIGWYGLRIHVVPTGWRHKRHGEGPINLLETKFGERVISRNGPVGYIKYNFGTNTRNRARPRTYSKVCNA